MLRLRVGLPPGHSSHRLSANREPWLRSLCIRHLHTARPASEQVREAIALLLGRRTFRLMTNYTTPPEHIFLSKREVIERYGWGRTKGYQLMASPDFPRSIGGRYRLDKLIAWEERQLAGTAPADRSTQSNEARDRSEVVELPRRRRTRAPRKEAS